MIAQTQLETYFTKHYKTNRVKRTLCTHVNHKDKKGEAVDEWYKMLDWEGWAFWRLEYDIYEGEGDKLHICNNLMGGFLSRAEHTSKYVFGKHCVMGEEGSLQIHHYHRILASDEVVKEHDS